MGSQKPDETNEEMGRFIHDMIDVGKVATVMREKPDFFQEVMLAKGKEVDPLCEIANSIDEACVAVQEEFKVERFSAARFVTGYFAGAIECVLINDARLTGIAIPPPRKEVIKEEEKEATGMLPIRKEDVYRDPNGN